MYSPRTGFEKKSQAGLATERISAKDLKDYASFGS